MKNKHKKPFINDRIYLEINIPLGEIEGIKLSQFQKAVLRAICNIPLGQTRSYQWVARRIGRPKSSRAVGQILKRNPFAPLVPCHRVIGSTGDIGGYSQGVKNKKGLLALERKIVEMIKDKKVK